MDENGELERLEIDGNNDGFFEKIQFYHENHLIRIEIDRNQGWNGRFPRFFQNKKSGYDTNAYRQRVKSSRSSNSTVRSNSWTMQRDTTADGRLDTCHEFEAGQLARSTQDTDGDGKTNVWQTYRNGQPVEQKTDGDGDGSVERIVRFDEKGRPSFGRHDLDEDGTFETERHYIDGEISRQETDGNGDGSPDGFLYFTAAQPCLQKRGYQLRQQYRCDNLVCERQGAKRRERHQFRRYPAICSPASTRKDSR